MDPNIVLESLRQAIADWESYGHCDIDNVIAAVAALGHGWECGLCGEFLQAG